MDYHCSYCSEKICEACFRCHHFGCLYYIRKSTRNEVNELKRQGFKQVEIAKMVGVTKQAVNQIWHEKS